MKTELEIAKENVGELKLSERDIRSIIKCEEHLASCKRFLEFLERLSQPSPMPNIEKKIQDLQEAIKIYKDNGFEDLEWKKK